MPYSARKSASKSKPWAIVNTKTGKVVGHSTSKTKAQRSVSIRNRSH